MSKYLDTRTDDGEPPAIRRLGINCAEASDLIPALALGVIETGERHAVRLHCQICPACARALEASQRVAAFIPFSGPVLTPPDRAMHALFARIADAQPASALSAPAFTTVTRIDAPVIDSPADKRRTAASSHAVQPAAQDRSIASWPISVLSSSVGRLATGSLALAFVLVTIYSLQSFDLINDGPEVTPPAAAQAQPTTVILTQATTESSQPEDGAAEPASGDVIALDTVGASATEPLLQQLPTDGMQTFVYKTVSSGSQTELLRSVAPSFADCALTEIQPGQYEVTVSGVNLPGNRQHANVYLVTTAGQRIKIGSIQINEFGDGTTMISIDQPLTDFRTLQIGPGQNGNGSPGIGTVSFSLTTSDDPRGLSASS